MAKPKKSPNFEKEFIEFLDETLYNGHAEAVIGFLSLSDVIKDLKQQYRLLKQYKTFYDHIAKHLEGTCNVVICKICNKTYQQIIIEEMLQTETAISLAEKEGIYERTNIK